MEISEKQLEDIIWETYNRDGGDKILEERGLPLKGQMVRQMGIGGGFGRADLLTFDIELVNSIKALKVQVIELKKDIVDFSTLNQAFGYQEGVFHALKYSDIDFDSFDCELILIGSHVDDNLALANRNLCNKIKPYQYSFCAYEGISFELKTYTGYSEKITASIDRDVYESLRDLCDWLVYLTHD